MIGRRGPDDAQSFDDAWNGRAPRDHEIAELVRTAELLCASAVAPRPEFRENLRARLLAEAADVLVAMPAHRPPAVQRNPHPRSARRRLATLTAAVVVCAGGVGLVTSSASAVPGDMLYPVKRGVESVQLALHRGDASRGGYQLQQAAERLAEAQELSKSDSPRAAERVARSLEDFADTARAGSTELFEHYRSAGAESSIQRVNDFTARAAAALAGLSDSLPAAADEAFVTATTAVTGLAERAAALCPVCDAADVASMVAAVENLARGGTPARSGAGGATSGDRPRKPSEGAAPTAEAPTAQDPPTPTPDAAPQLPGITPAPVPTPAVTTAPTLGGVVDPLLGGLLGDEEQEGLVPGLLNGLLGPKK